jgi:hypothetical protein
MALVDRALLERLFSSLLGRSLLGLAAISVVLAPHAKADEGAPDLDFLAYLGSWQESDEEWLAVAEWEGEQQVKDDVRAAAQRKDDENET